MAQSGHSAHNEGEHEEQADHVSELKIGTVRVMKIQFLTGSTRRGDEGDGDSDLILKVPGIQSPPTASVSSSIKWQQQYKWGINVCTFNIA